MSCRCSHPSSGDTGRAIADISWSGPQMGNRGVRVGPRRPTLDELDEPKEVLRSEVIELLSMREVRPDGRANATEAFSMPFFAIESVDSAVVSVAVAAQSGLAGPTVRRLWVRVQNAARTSDDPSVLFFENGASVAILSSTVAPALLTIAWPLVGPGARLLLEWEQGTIEFSPPTTPVASVTLSVWLTLRRRGAPPL